MARGVGMERADGPLSLDDVVVELQELRLAAGAPSYAEIVQRITRLRVARGLTEAAARPARTTVYDAFRIGRRRLDVGLVLDIVEALGAGPGEIAEWADRCRRAQQSTLRQAQRPTAPAASSVPAAPPGEVPVRPAVLAQASLSAGLAALTWTARTRTVLMVVCVAVNLLGRGLVDVLHLPLYLDMAGTAVAAVILGPWWGAGVGASTNLAGALVSGPASIPFAVVNVIGALVWGYGARSVTWSRSLPRYFLLNVVVAASCTVAAVPIILFAFRGATTHGADDVAATMVALGAGLAVAVMSVNLLTSVADKVISGFVALVVLEALVARRSATPDVPQQRGPASVPRGSLGLDLDSV